MLGLLGPTGLFQTKPFRFSGRHARGGTGGTSASVGPGRAASRGHFRLGRCHGGEGGAPHVTPRARRGLAAALAVSRSPRPRPPRAGRSRSARSRYIKGRGGSAAAAAPGPRASPAQAAGPPVSRGGTRGRWGDAAGQVYCFFWVDSPPRGWGRPGGLGTWRARLTQTPW